MKAKVIGTFDGGHERTGKVSISENICCVCKDHKKVLGMDNSDEEYKTGYICFDCIEKEKDIK